MKLEWPIWREITIPAHQGTEDLLRQIEQAGMHVESWAKELILAHRIRRRASPLTFPVARVASKQLGFFTPGGLVYIVKTKSRGRNCGLELLNIEKILALRLDYADQPREWMRVAMATLLDEDCSCLDLVLVNDGNRMDIRTNWAFPSNQFQSEHEWFWEIL